MGETTTRSELFEALTVIAAIARLFV
jgi:hypothetical protein